MQRRSLTIFMLIIAFLAPLSIANGFTILSPHQYAWSNNVGYINFKDVIVENNALSGFAWSTNTGFINFAPAQGGVFNDGTGNLSGSAWGEGLGYIDFDNVSINPITGKFSGTATGSLVGILTFDCPNFCDVVTDWPGNLAIPPPPPSGGGGRSRITGSSGFVSLAPLDNSAMFAQAKLIDIKKDGSIDIFDFNQLMVNWGSTVCGNPSDTNDDCKVDILDFNILMVYWGITYQL